MPWSARTLRSMNDEDARPRSRDDAVIASLGAQDLDPLSVTELHERIAALETEIARVRAKIAAAVNHKASAEALFRR